MSDATDRHASALQRWRSGAKRVRQVACVGDSITRGIVGRTSIGSGARGNWVDQLAAALDDAYGPRPGDGFRGLWRDEEWQQTGAWNLTGLDDAFDVAPFGQGLYSSGQTVDHLAWTNPASTAVAAFDLYWFHMPGMGNWQFRVDDGPWINVGAPTAVADNRLHRLHVDRAVRSRVEIRGFDGTAACIAPIAGIGLYRTPRPASTGAVVHNLGHNNQLLAWFCRSGAGDALALLDDLRPDLVTILFSNDSLYDDSSTFGHALRTLVIRVKPYADVLIIAPYEQPRESFDVRDAITRDGSAIVISRTRPFLPSDAGRSVTGTNIAANTTIASVQSTREATLSAPATGSCAGGELAIERRRDADVQADYRTTAREIAETMDCAFLDLYESWAAISGAGCDAATAFGLMADALHPSQLGHDEIAARVRQIVLGTGS